MATNYQAFRERIRKAQTIEDVQRLEKSLDILWGAGIFTVPQFCGLDGHICDRLDSIKEQSTKQEGKLWVLHKHY